MRHTSLSILPQKGGKQMLLLRRFMWIIVSRVISAALQALSIILVARAAGAENFGLLTAFMGIVIILQTLSDMGITTYVIRLRSKVPNSPDLAWALQIYRRLGFLLGVALAAVAASMAIMLSQPWWLLVPLGVAGSLERQSNIRLAMAVADGEVWKNSLNMIARRSLTLGLVLAAIELGVNPVLSFGVASFAASLLSLWLSWRLVTVVRSEESVNHAKFKEIFQVSRHFWANSLGVQLRNLDAFLVTIIGGVSTGGYYGAISRSLNPLMLVSSSLAGIVLPMAAREQGRPGRNIKTPVAIVTVLTSLMYVTLAFNAETLVLLLFGRDYLQATNGLRIVLIGLIFASLSSLQTAFLQARGAERAVGRVAIATSLVSLTSISVGVAVAGVDGAALGLASSYAVQCTALLVLGRRHQEPSDIQSVPAPI
ncbi:lipopolysaccharide biosynthesis protein [Kocuria arenosa]|uniref:lipopolysaccharide biosynthesis protein n=1 Tax=Kocuria arenosa TaxID=3071446 RepID=UPI0034D58267